MSTLATLTGNIRRNLSEASAKLFIDADIYYWIGVSYKYYYHIMIYESEGFFEETANLGFTANNPLVSLSSLSPAFFRVSELERNTSSGSFPLKQSERRNRPNYSIGQGAGDGYRPRWKLRGLNLVLEPTPTATESASSTTGLKLDYVGVPTFPDASSSSSFSFDAQFPVTFEPMIEKKATIMALESKDAMGGISDISSFRAELELEEIAFRNILPRCEEADEVEYVGTDYSNPFI